MGTRADFYVGTGKDAEWLGSLAYDGYRIHEMTKEAISESLDNMECWEIKSAASEKAFRFAVERLLRMNKSATLPTDGWPWPWEDSCTTDYAYCFVDGACKSFTWGRPINEGAAEDHQEPQAEWPNMKDRQNVTLGERSSVIVVIARR
jgi:hypothetical protein